MDDIYKYESQNLRELLDNAAQNGSNVLIPDLQRSYVWQPHQVILLVDSIIRGWPFGTLLTWKYKCPQKEGEDSYGIPARGFFQKVSRTSKTDNFNKSFDPASVGYQKEGYTMILDGQQRLQSLILAFYKETGIQLVDYDWYASIDPEDIQQEYYAWIWMPISMKSPIKTIMLTQ